MNDTMISNGIGLMKKYLPNLFVYISEKEFEQFLRKSYQHTEKNGGGTPNNNFLFTFFKLIDEHYNNKSNDIRNEFGYFNFLLEKFIEFGQNKDFKNLIKGSLTNFKSSNFKHVLGEAAACVDLCSKAKFLKYEIVLENKKSLDFQFQFEENHTFYIDVVSYDFDKTKYENEKFEKFLDDRLLKKFNEKVHGLEDDLKERVIIYPILYGFTIEIVKEQEKYLKSIKLSRVKTKGFQSFEPKFFGNIQGTFFNLFSVNQIVNSEKYYH